jgi:hypothetical protein
VILGTSLAYAMVYGLLGIRFGLERVERKRIIDKVRSIGG